MHKNLQQYNKHTHFIYILQQSLANTAYVLCQILLKLICWLYSFLDSIGFAPSCSAVC